MKTILCIALLIPGLVFGATVTFNLTDFLGTTQTLQRKTVEIVPLSTVRGSGETVVLSEKRTFSTGTNGVFTATNMSYGLYRVSVVGNSSSTFRILVPETSSNLLASDLIHNGPIGVLHSEDGRPLLLE